MTAIPSHSTQQLLNFRLFIPFTVFVLHSHDLVYAQPAAPAATAPLDTAPAVTAPPATTPPSATITPQSGPPAAGVVKAAPTPAPIKLGQFTVSGYNRTRGESFDFFEGATGDGNYNYVGNLLRLGIGLNRRKTDFQFELNQPTLFNLPTDAAAPPPAGQLGLGASYFAANGNDRQPQGLFVQQAFVRFKGIGGAANSLRLGRFEFAEGIETTPKDSALAYLKRERIAQRLIGTFGFTHAQRSFDGLQLVRNTPAANITLVGARATEGVFQVRGNGELDVDFLYGAYTVPRARSDARLFAAHYRDGRSDVVKVDNRPLALRQADRENIGVTTLGAHYLTAFKAGGGTADVLAWGALQGGDWGNLDHRAAALALEAGYQPRNTRLKPWLRVGYFRSSGDRDPSDGRHGTFFQMLPTPRIYARFPFYNLMNNEDAFAQLILRPNSRFTVRLDAHQVRLGNVRDLYYSGGGAFEDNTFGYAGRPSGGSRSLASVYDISLDYQLSARTQVGFYLGAASGGRVISNIYPRDNNGRFAFLEVTNRF
ncbi:MAG: alginate export family protein [Armatimonadetes bacterium]|nr:alginate export family protein [Armatimonadota bacterium]